MAKQLIGFRVASTAIIIFKPRKQAGIWWCNAVWACVYINLCISCNGSFFLHPHFYQIMILWKWSLVFLRLCLNIKKSDLTLRCLEIRLHGQSTSKYPRGGLSSQDKTLSLRLLRLHETTPHAMVDDHGRLWAQAGWWPKVSPHPAVSTANKNAPGSSQQD